MKMITLHTLEGSDFTVFDRSLVFPDAGQTQCFSVGVVNDRVYEDLEEMFAINLSSDNPRVQFSSESLMIIILDDESKNIPMIAQ